MPASVEDGDKKIIQHALYSERIMKAKRVHLLTCGLCLLVALSSPIGTAANGNIAYTGVLGTGMAIQKTLFVSFIWIASIYTGLGVLRAASMLRTLNSQAMLDVSFDNIFKALAGLEAKLISWDHRTMQLTGLASQVEFQVNVRQRTPSEDEPVPAIDDYVDRFMAGPAPVPAGMMTSFKRQLSAHVNSIVRGTINDALERAKTVIANNRKEADALPELSQPIIKEVDKLREDLKTFHSSIGKGDKRWYYGFDLGTSGVMFLIATSAFFTTIFAPAILASFIPKYISRSSPTAVVTQPADGLSATLTPHSPPSPAAR